MIKDRSTSVEGDIRLGIFSLEKKDPKDVFLMYKIIRAMNKETREKLDTIFVKQEQGALNEIIIQKIFSKQREVLFHTLHN